MVATLEQDAPSRPRVYTGRELREKASEEHPRFSTVLFPDDGGEHAEGLARQIQRELRPRLALKQERGSYGDHRSLLDDYGQSADAIRQATNEARAFFEAVWRASVSYQVDGEVVTAVRDEPVEEYYGGLHKYAAAPLIHPKPILSAELEAIWVETAEIKLQRDLDQTVKRFAEAVAQGLDELRKSEVIGYINWATPTACDAFCIQDVVTREEFHEEVSRETQEVLDVDYSRNVRRIREEVRQVRKTRHVVKHGLRLFYLSDASQCRIDDFDQFVPENIQQLLTSLPIWLKPLVRIIPGTRRTDILSLRNLFVEEREQEKIYNEERDEEMLQESRCGCPVVLLGKHVLAGWGTQEETVEAARQGQSLFSWLAVLLLLLAAGLMALGQLLHPVFGYLAAGPAPLSLVAFAAGLRERSIYRRRPTSWLRLSSAGLSWTVLSFGLLGVAAGLASLHWVLLCVGALLFGIGGKMLLGVLSRD